MFGDPRVTFGAGGLDRSAHLRGDAVALARLAAAPESRSLVFWRGRPLMGAAGLARVEMDHPALAGAAVPMLLGLGPEGAVFVHDLSHWQPEGVGVEPDRAFADPAPVPHPAFAATAGFCDLRSVMADLSTEEAELAASAKAVLAWHETHPRCARCGAESRVVMAGWQRQCGACGAMHFPRTDPVVIMLVVRGNDVLLGRSPGWPEGVYSLLAGFMEPGETIEAAVRREVAEEAGVKIGAVRYLASQPWPFPASLMIGCLAEATSARIEHDPGEIEHALWLTREELAEVFAGLHPTVKAPRRGSIAEFLMRQWLADRLPDRA